MKSGETNVNYVASRITWREGMGSEKKRKEIKRKVAIGDKEKGK